MNDYLNLHILNSLAFANPNRDDAGAPKTAFYGGVERARMSSQSLKRAARIGFESAVGAPTVRTADVASLVAARLDERGVGPIDDPTWELIDQSIRTLVEKEPKPKPKGETEGDDADVASGDTLMWVSPAEVEALAAVFEEELGDGGKLAAAKKLSSSDLKMIGALVRSAVEEPSLSVAAFGRMFANSVGNAVDAAVQVSHALSTHEHVVEVDYFTAVDDLQAHGAGYIGLNMFTGAVYYRHVCIDRAQLGANMGDRLGRQAGEIESLVRSICVDLPTGKQAGAAHQSLPSLVLAVTGSRPANLVEAFEEPVRSDGGYVKPSVNALSAYLGDVATFFPSVFGEAWVAGRSEYLAQFGEAAATDLDGLARAVSAWALEPPR